jgi:hypothetical protein
MEGENDIVISEDLLNKFRLFIRDNDPLRISRNLRKVFFDYLRFQQDCLDNDFDQILSDVETVINLMECIGKKG